MPCAPESGGPGHSARRQASRRAREARRPARDHRKGAGRVVGHIGGVGSRPDHHATPSAGVSPDRIGRLRLVSREQAATSFAREWISATRPLLIYLAGVLFPEGAVAGGRRSPLSL